MTKKIPIPVKVLPKKKVEPAKSKSKDILAGMEAEALERRPNWYSAEEFAEKKEKS